MKKQAKQKRSKEMVEAVLEAATRILKQVGLKETTTNKIAEMAGVGIGSLYDYFPNKDSIAVALIDQRITSILKDYENLLMDSRGSLQDLINLSLDFISLNFLKQRGFLREVFFLAPKSGRMETLYLARAQATRLLAQHFITQHKRDPEWAERKAFVAYFSIQGLLDAYIVLAEYEFQEEAFKAEAGLMLRAILEV